MTLAQMQPRPTGANPVQRRVTEVVDAAGPQVCDDMSVEVALAVLAAARTGRLVVCDQDGQCTGLVTQADLAAVRESSAYTDRVRLRDIRGDYGPFTSPVTASGETGHAMRSLRLGALPAVDKQGSTQGHLLALSH
ncbi:CBS domain-containing protein [Streptomyces violascens]|uniref:CBS domain-containing protein n=1 Tax=Streptomyces violascens TaxID=67381 RepID=UPI0036532016